MEFMSHRRTGSRTRHGRSRIVALRVCRVNSVSFLSSKVRRLVSVKRLTFRYSDEYHGMEWRKDTAEDGIEILLARCNI